MNNKCLYACAYATLLLTDVWLHRGHHILLPFTDVTGTAGKVVLARDMLNREAEGLHGQVPTGYSAVGVFHLLKPLQSLVVRLQNKFPSQTVIFRESKTHFTAKHSFSMME